MTRLATHPAAYVRPSPAGTSLGGITRTTPSLLQLLGAVGFDTIMIETVGVGQSEHLAALWAHCFILLLSPGAGDELQGIKRGVMEVADVVAVADRVVILKSGRKVADRPVAGLEAADLARLVISGGGGGASPGGGGGTGVAETAHSQ